MLRFFFFYFPCLYFHSYLRKCESDWVEIFIEDSPCIINKESDIPICPVTIIEFCTCKPTLGTVHFKWLCSHDFINCQYTVIFNEFETNRDKKITAPHKMKVKNDFFHLFSPFF